MLEKYKVYLDNIIEESNIKIIIYPTSQEFTKKISFKYFNNIKPFDENKMSFQDAIMWESIVEYCYDIVEYCYDIYVESISFISDNHTDFAKKMKMLFMKT